jgi:hypothetical protein
MWTHADEDAVTVVYHGMPASTVLRRDVTGLQEFVHVGLRIQTADPERDLFVPAWTKSYDGVRARLSDWMPVTRTRAGRVRPDALPFMAILYALALFLPMVFVPFVVPQMAAGLASLGSRDSSVIRKLVSLGPAAILITRWLL